MLTFHAVWYMFTFCIVNVQMFCSFKTTEAEMSYSKRYSTSLVSPSLSKYQRQKLSKMIQMGKEHLWKRLLLLLFMSIKCVLKLMFWASSSLLKF